MTEFLYTLFALVIALCYVFGKEHERKSQEERALLTLKLLKKISYRKGKK